MLCVLWLIVDNASINLVMVLIEMRWEANYKFIEQSTYAIDVCSSVMTLAKKDLRAHVFGRSTKRVRSLPLRDDFGQTKIRNLNMPVNINEYILRLDIPVDNIHVMEVLQPEQ